ncbi:UNVERIFIED_CONTAM: Inducible nitrate reductase [NADH] 2 [Sesamum latifolium]|uniref:Inducible nitrate reductase [NADH] 2 n=1 Tax=Sesamum latifolium TaxID=2727402 RepID=A0AAW2XCS0_9LAMI
MNNCWFRVKANVCKPHNGEIGIVFKHPTQFDNQSDRWMAKEWHLEKSSNENQTLKKNASSSFMNTTSKTLSISEVEKHNSPDFAWIIVYDCTRFLKDHHQRHRQYPHQCWHQLHGGIRRHILQKG